MVVDPVGHGSAERRGRAREHCARPRSVPCPGGLQRLVNGEGPRAGHPLVATEVEAMPCRLQPQVTWWSEGARAAPTFPSSSLDLSAQAVPALSFHPLAIARASCSVPPIACPGKTLTPPQFYSSTSSPARSFVALFRRPRNSTRRARMSSGPCLPCGLARNRWVNRAWRHSRRGHAGVSLLSAATIPTGVGRKAPRLLVPCGSLLLGIRPSCPADRSKRAPLRRGGCPGRLPFAGYVRRQAALRTLS